MADVITYLKYSTPYLGILGCRRRAGPSSDALITFDFLDKKYFLQCGGVNVWSVSWSTYPKPNKIWMMLDV